MAPTTHHFFPLQQQHASIEDKEGEWSNVRASEAALRSVNPIRRTLEDLAAVSSSNGGKKISLALGDPSAFAGDFAPPQHVIDALLDACSSSDSNGYAPAPGTPLFATFRAVAKYVSKDLPLQLSAEDVFLTPGCSQAINLCIASLARRGCNMLLPSPGFPLYESFCKLYGVEVRRYELLPDKEWRVDLHSLEALGDFHTAAIVVCNPGNPTGSVYTCVHLNQIAKVATKLRVPILADEIYAHIAFGDNLFVSMATFAKDVPVLVVGGISKRWFVPGWRLGWVCACDPHGILKRAKVQEALLNLEHLHLSTGKPVQAALPSILHSTPPKVFTHTLKLLSRSADICYERVQKINGLSCNFRPQGSMYILVRVDCADFVDLSSDVDFAQSLCREQNVMVLPGTAFGYPGWLRLFIAAPVEVLDEAWDRVEVFCKRHIIN